MQILLCIYFPFADYFMIRKKNLSNLGHSYKITISCQDVKLFFQCFNNIFILFECMIFHTLFCSWV